MNRFLAICLLLCPITAFGLCNIISPAMQAKFKALNIPEPEALTEYMTAVQLAHIEQTVLTCRAWPEETAKTLNDLDTAIAWRVLKFATAQGSQYRKMLVLYAAGRGQQNLTGLMAIEWLKDNHLIDRFRTWDATDVALNFKELAKRSSPIAAHGTGWFAGKFTVANALLDIFGNYDANTDSSTVTVRDNGVPVKGTATALAERAFVEGGISKHVLITSAVGNEAGAKCHACGAHLGVFVFGQRSKRWILVSKAADIGQFGAWGEPGEISIMRFAPDEWGFTITSSSMAQGIGETTEDFIAPVRGRYKDVLQITAKEDDDGFCFGRNSKCYANKSTIQLLRTGRTLPDIEVDRVGTRPDDYGKVISANERVVYSFNGTKYVEQSSQHLKMQVPAPDVEQTASTAANFQVPVPPLTGDQQAFLKLNGDSPKLNDAAQQGNLDAEIYLGYAYDIGKGVPHNPYTALIWYKKALAHPKIAIAVQDWVQTRINAVQSEIAKTDK